MSTTCFDLKGSSCGNDKYLQNNKLLHLPCITLYTTYILHSEEFTAVLLLLRKEKLKQMFYTNLCSPMIGLWGLAQEGAEVL